MMSSYKPGDLAALFPKPPKATTESGKKIQSLFEDFYKKSGKAHFNTKQEKKLNHKEENIDKPLKGKDSFQNVSDTFTTTKKTKSKKKLQKESNVDHSESLANESKTETDISETKHEKEVESFPRRSRKKNKPKADELFTGPQTKFEDFDDEGDEKLYFVETQETNILKNKKKRKHTSLGNANEEFEIGLSEALSNDEKSKKKKKKQSLLNTENHLKDLDREISDETEMTTNTNKKKNKKKRKQMHFEDNDTFQNLAPEITKSAEKRKNVDTPAETSSSSEAESENLPDNVRLEDNIAKKDTENETEESMDEDDESGFDNFSSEKSSLSQSMHNADDLVWKAKKKNAVVEDDAERMSRTLFVGNLPVDISRKTLSKLFTPFGEVDTCRLRGVVPEKKTLPKKIAEISHKFHSGLTSRIGYVVMKTAADAKKALVLSGTLVGDHHITVDIAKSKNDKRTYDEKRSVFIGNLPFNVSDEMLWQGLSPFGPLEAIRVIRDRETGVSKGFAYACFQNMSSKDNALSANDVEIGGRIVRINNVERKKKNAGKPALSRDNALKRIARKKQLKGKNETLKNSKKSLKKIMNKEKMKFQKKKIANIFKNLSK